MVHIYPILNKFIFLIFLSFVFSPHWLIGQGSYNQENFGNRSILLSGNVTGSVDDLGFTYYNPARIALVENPVFSINAKAFQMNTVNIQNVFGRDDKLSNSRFEGIPSLVAGTFEIEKWKNHHFAYAFLSKQRSRLNLNVSEEVNPDNNSYEIDDLDRFVGDFELDNRETDEWFGITWGTKLRDNLSIGVSTFVSVYNYRSLFDLRFAALDEGSNVGIFNNEIKVGQSSYGVFWKVGLAWKLEKFDIGLNVDLPYLEVIGNGKFRYQRFLSGNDPGNEDFQFYDFKDLETNRKEPLGISFGLGLPVKKHTIHFKVDWHAGISEYDRIVIPPVDDDGTGFVYKEALRSVINFGVGGEIYLNDHLNLYGSFSTDFSPTESHANVFDLIDDEGGDANFDADYMHYGLGLDIKFKKVKLVVGSTYSTASGDFSEPIEFPISGVEQLADEDSSRIRVTRWKFIIGLEIPIFGYDIEVK